MWYDLMRRSAEDKVSGAIRLSFAWDVTARSLLTLKLSALERVLAQRVEVLCMLNPVSAETAMEWAKEDSEAADSSAPDSKVPASQSSSFSQPQPVQRLWCSHCLPLILACFSPAFMTVWRVPMVCVWNIRGGRWDQLLACSCTVS